MYKQKGVNEWLVMDEENMQFHMRQFEQPYRSTVHFMDFLKANANLCVGALVDVGCGAGSALDYLVNQNSVLKKGIGLDINEELVKIGNKILKEKDNNECELFCQDIFNPNRNLIELCGGGYWSDCTSGV